MKRWIAVVVLVVLAFGAVGCNWKDEAERRDEAREIIGGNVKDAWKAETGEEIGNPSIPIPRSNMSESHAVMASMILLGRGMSPDLDTYSEVYLVEFTDAAGVERAAVYANNKVVLPANAGQ